jgi:hypothetical protein
MYTKNIKKDHKNLLLFLIYKVSDYEKDSKIDIS